MYAKLIAKIKQIKEKLETKKDKYNANSEIAKSLHTAVQEAEKALKTYSESLKKITEEMNRKKRVTKGLTPDLEKELQHNADSEHSSRKFLIEQKLKTCLEKLEQLEQLFDQYMHSLDAQQTSETLVSADKKNSSEQQETKVSAEAITEVTEQLEGVSLSPTPGSNDIPAVQPLILSQPPQSSSSSMGDTSSKPGTPSRRMAIIKKPTSSS